MNGPQKGWLDRLLASRLSRRSGSFISVLFFLLVIFIPVIWIFSYSAIYWDLVFQSVFMEADVLALMVDALTLSLSVAAIVTLIDMFVGLVIAWILVRYTFPGKDLVDTLIDLPVTVPTSALGLSIFLFWGTKRGLASLLGVEGGLFSPGPLLIILLHVVFCLPYIVRSVVGVISQINMTHEHASRTLGASSFTTFRTVGLPQIIPGIISGGTLSFTRSISETGATMIVAGSALTAPVLIVDWRDSLLPAAALLGTILVAISCCLVVVARFISEKWRVPLFRARPEFERLISTNPVRKARDVLAFVILLGAVLVPTCFVVIFSGGIPEIPWSEFWVSLGISFLTAGLVSGLGVVTGIPLAMIIAKGGNGRIRMILDALVNVSVTVPTSALALSLYLFWGPNWLGLLDFGLWLVLVTHITLAYPYVVRPIIAALESMEPAYEEAAKTLGARPFTVFRSITYPIIRPAILAGIIMAFTRSVSETGATMVASKGMLTTIPVLIVRWIKPAIDSYLASGKIQLLVDAAVASAFPSALLIAVSFTLLVVFRLAMGRVKGGVAV